MDSCFALIAGARQHCVAKICNASPTANAVSSLPGCTILRAGKSSNLTTFKILLTSDKIIVKIENLKERVYLKQG